MIVRPSIAFSGFSGSAKGVTARSVRGRTVLSSKSQHSSITTPAQAVSRSTLSRISRSYKQLSDSQMKGWETLAGHLKGISTFDWAAELTAHNAYVRINTNRIEKFGEYDGNGSFEILLCSMFTTRGYRGEVAKLTKTAVKFTVLSDVSAKANDLVCVTAEGWCFVHLYFNTSSSFFSKEIKARLDGFPEDASADVFLVGGGQQTKYRGAHISEGRIENGILTVPEPAASMSDTGENPFLYAFIVRDTANASEETSTDEVPGGVSTNEKDSVQDLDNQQK